MTTRRGFMQGILALGVAPAIIKLPGILMPVKSIVRQPYGLPTGMAGYHINTPADIIKDLAESILTTKEQVAYNVLSASGIFAKVVRPGMDLAWADAYSNMVPVTWEEFYKSS